MGTAPEITSPQGRFAAGAQLITGREMTDARAVGKQMFLEFEERDWLRVHLGMYGAWDFAGDIEIHPSIEIHGVADEAGEDSLVSIGAPRLARIRMAEEDRERASAETFPPEPVGQVRVRLLNDLVCADLRGPTVCEVITPEEKVAVLRRLGPDPANDDSPEEQARFVDRAARTRTPIGLVLMDQSIIAGIGNVYRAELLFRAGLSPHVPSNEVGRERIEALWDDWVHLLDIGIRVGQMITIDGLHGEDYERALAQRDERHWVYKLENTPCKRCGTNILLEEFGARKLYWCPTCQVTP